MRVKIRRSRSLHDCRKRVRAVPACASNVGTKTNGRDRNAIAGNMERRTTNRHVHTPGHAQCFVKAGLLACRHPSPVMPSRAEHSGVGPGSSGLQQRGLRRTGTRWSSRASPASRFTLRQTSRRAPFTCERDSTGRNARLSPPYCAGRWRNVPAHRGIAPSCSAFILAQQTCTKHP